MIVDAFGEEGRDANNGVHSIPPGSILNIDVELVSFKPVIDITGDSKVLKKILKEGEGAVIPNEGATVTSKYSDAYAINLSNIVKIDLDWKVMNDGIYFNLN